MAAKKDPLAPARAMLDDRGIAYTGGDDIAFGTDVASGAVCVVVNAVVVVDTFAEQAAADPDVTGDPDSA